MRLFFPALAVLAAPLMLAATPAAAQYAGPAGPYAAPYEGPHGAERCDCGPGGSYTETGPAYLVVPRTTYVPHTAYAARTVLVPRTRLVPRVVYVPRTRLVPRIVEVPHTTYSAHTRFSTYPAQGPAYGGGYPRGYRYGATYVPPGAAYGCRLGTAGCDSSYVEPFGD